VARKDNVLTASNAAIRFTPPRAERGEGKPAGGGGESGPPAARPAGGGKGRGQAEKKLWRVGATGDPEAVPIQLGISDGNVTEIAAGDLKEGDPVIIGIETPRGGKKPDALPPGFGSGQQRRPGGRDRGL